MQSVNQPAVDYSDTRVMHLIGALRAGGAERAAVDLACHQKQAGAEVAFTMLSNEQDAAGRAWQQRMEDLGITCRFAPTARFSFGSIRWLASTLKAHRGILHIHLPYAERAYYFARMLHKRRYAVIRKLNNTRLPESSTIRWAVMHSDIRHSVACGRSVYDALSGTIAGRIDLVPNGMRFTWPIKTPELQAQARGELGLSEDHLHYVVAGRMGGPSLAQAQKGHNVAIKAWHQASQSDGRPAHLHLLGDGNLMDELKALAQGDETIHFYGSVDNVPTWLIACDYFLFPTRYEGLPNALVEAASAGIACLTSDIPPCLELDLTTQQIFPVDNVDALTQLLIDNRNAPPPAPLTEQAQDIQSRYGIEQSMRGHLAAYQAAIQASPKAGS